MPDYCFAKASNTFSSLSPIKGLVLTHLLFMCGGNSCRDKSSSKIKKLRGACPSAHSSISIFRLGISSSLLQLFTFSISLIVIPLFLNKFFHSIIEYLILWVVVNTIVFAWVAVIILFKFLTQHSLNIKNPSGCNGACFHAGAVISTPSKSKSIFMI